MGTHDDLIDAIREHRTRVVVTSALGIDSIALSTGQPRTDWDKLAVKSGYRLISTHGLTRIYLLGT
jgi:hypothetical protein